jgi:hypothetical protein
VREGREGAKGREGDQPSAKRFQKCHGKHDSTIVRIALRAGTISSRSFASSRPSREILVQKLSRQNDGCCGTDSNTRTTVACYPGTQSPQVKQVQDDERGFVRSTTPLRLCAKQNIRVLQQETSFNRSITMRYRILTKPAFLQQTRWVS